MSFMGALKSSLSGRLWPAVEHSLRTALAAGLSLGLAELLRLPAPYWAPITAVVIMQSTLGAAWTVSVQRFAGTIIGAAAGALVAPVFGANPFAFTLGVFLLGLLCAALRVDNSAYRFAGITLAIVMIIPHKFPAWVTALNRFLEVSVGILVALALTYLWPESSPLKNSQPNK